MAFENIAGGKGNNCYSEGFSHLNLPESKLNIKAPVSLTPEMLLIWTGLYFIFWVKDNRIEQ